ncbi:MAG: hypothetical protein JXQ25_01445, partial [Deltaproteobacteria bacterium]|nr:hypothetical protein [Deltaproteobacteria bacterium]
DGVEKAATDCSGMSFDSAGSGLVTGRFLTNYSWYYLDGYMDEIRITKGTALWTEDFTPPNNPE